MYHGRKTNDAGRANLNGVCDIVWYVYTQYHME